ncbi:hypothetical protein IJ531_04050 [bacterium]|nr:hypothetical protein [bacterium]
MNNKEVLNIPNIGIAEVSDYIPEADMEKKIIQFEEQAEADIAKLKNTANVHFRWSEFEIKRAKKIAAKMGLPYQTYIKMTLKQAMDKDELKYN